MKTTTRALSSLSSCGDESGSSGVTYKNQGSLPRLPIPPLEETMARFPRLLKALQTTKEKEEMEKAIQEFLKQDGPKLQELLIKYEEEGRQAGTLGSYVEEFWNDSYLAPDCSLVLNLNPFFVLEEGPDPDNDRNQLGRASSLLYAALLFVSTLKRESLTPDNFRNRPLCMDQFQSLFGSCRIPVKDDKDYVAVDPNSSHVVVMKRNRLYYFQALWPSDVDDGATLACSRDDILDILQAIERDVQETEEAEDSAKSAVGVLTTLPRKEWAKVRHLLLEESQHNKDVMQIIDTALFVLVLDDFVPQNVHQTAENMLHGSYQLTHAGTNKKNAINGECKHWDNLISYQTGTCSNRWYDKLQIIVCNNGSAGVNFEHSSIDGHTALRFVSDIFAQTVVQFAQSITKTIYGIGRIPSVLEAPIRRAIKENNGNKLDTRPKRLTFQFTEGMVDRILRAEAKLGDEVVSSDVRVLEFKDYGKTFVVTHNMSPDSFVQMAILVAYYQLYGKVVCQYEPVLTKQYLHGRTEAMRSCTSRAATFCELWCSSTASLDKKIEALKAATAEHSSYVKECAAGKGIERHLFALKCIADKFDLPMPSFFKSKAWTTVNHTILSTSNCGNPSLRLFGFGPVVPDGFGIGYIIKDSAIHFTISSKSRQTDRYKNSLHRILLEVMDVLGNGDREVMVASPHPVKNNKKAVSSDSGKVYYSEGFDEYDNLTPLPTPSPKQEIYAEKKKHHHHRHLHNSGNRSSFYLASVKRTELDREVLQKVGEHVVSRSSSMESEPTSSI